MPRILPALVVVVACGTPGGKPIPHPEPRPRPVTPPGPPVAERRAVTDTYHGTSVDDPYRWLEADAPEVQSWTDGQNGWAREQLDKLPDLTALHDEVEAIVAAPILRYFALEPAGKVVFALRKDPAKQQAELVVLDDPAAPETARVVLDPTAAGDATRAIDWFVPAPDGSKVAISMSTGGSEAGTLHVIDLAGAELEPPIPDVQRGTGGGDIAWTPDGKGFYYTRYPNNGEPHADEPDLWMRVWFHKLGALRSEDRNELGDDLPKIAEIRLTADPKGRVLASIQKGDGGEFRYYVRDAKGRWTQLADWPDAVVWVGWGPGDDLLLVSRLNAPHGKVLRVGRNKPVLARARPLIAEGKDAIVTDYYEDGGVVVTKDRLYVTYQLGGPSEPRAFTVTGKPAANPQLPPVSSTTFPVPWQRGVLVRAASYTTPSTWYRIDGKTGAATELTALSPKPPVDLSAFEVKRELATSKDGTPIPINIVWPRGAAQDGSTRCLVTGYGGFGASEEPGFMAAWAPLLTRGMCVVDVNLRGGGEFGEDWHRAGMLTRKQNVFDDFAAALAYLIEHDYTRRERLAILGGSNGGLLMGAMLSQHPELPRVVVSLAGIYDMLRNEQTPNGKYITSEYGTVDDADQFAALYAYSPYHHLPMGTRFPAVLFTTGANDPRVAPWQSRKMIAALQHANAGDAPILLMTSTTSGHGAGTAMTELIDRHARMLAFILAELGR